MLAMSRWSNNESCSVPPSSNPLIAGARSAVIQWRPADLISSVMRALADMRCRRQDDMIKVEALLELVDLARQRHRIGGIAVKHRWRPGSHPGRRAGRRRTAACPSCRRGYSHAWRADSGVPSI